MLTWMASGLNGIVLGYGGLGEGALEQGLRAVAMTVSGAASYQPTGQNT